MTDTKNLFAADEEPDAPDPGLFSDDDVTPDKDFVAEIVGDGKKFKDTNALAKSKIASDNHILRIESENAQLRQELKTRLSLEEFYDQVKTKMPSPSSPQHTLQDETERSEISIEQVESLVGKRFQEHMSQEQQKNNLTYVQQEVERRLGPNFKKLMRDRAAEVGEAEENLTTLAMTKPKLFLELMVPKVSPSESIPNLPRTQIDTGKMGNLGSTVRNQSFYAKLKQSDPKKYKSREVQAQMHKDALALRDKFFQ
jgi:hypothetical protein